MKPTFVKFRLAQANRSLSPNDYHIHANQCTCNTLAIFSMLYIHMDESIIKEEVFSKHFLNVFLWHCLNKLGVEGGN